MQTRICCQWILDKWKVTDGKGELCGPGWLHCYQHPLLAALLHPIHVMYDGMRLFKAEVNGRGKHDGQIKSGYTKMRLIEEISMPEITREQRVRFAILCAKKVYSDQNWYQWAEGWLSGNDRTKAAALSARRTATTAAEEASWAAWAAREAALSARRTATTAAEAAEAATAGTSEKLNLIKLAEQAIKEESK